MGGRDAGCGMRDSGCGMQDSGFGMRDAGYYGGNCNNIENELL